MPGGAVLSASRALSHFLFIVAQLLKWVYRLDPESDPEQEKSRQSGDYMTSGIWQISGIKRAGKRMKSTD